MWTRLQQHTAQIVFGLAFVIPHSALCLVLYKVSLDNMELGGLWETMRSIDLPVSLLLDHFYELHWRIWGETSQSTYHVPYLLFHLVVGGIQFFVWGWLLASIGRMLLRSRS